VASENHVGTAAFGCPAGHSPAAAPLLLTFSFVDRWVDENYYSYHCPKALESETCQADTEKQRRLEVVINGRACVIVTGKTDLLANAFMAGTV